MLILHLYQKHWFEMTYLCYNEFTYWIVLEDDVKRKFPLLSIIIFPFRVSLFHNIKHVLWTFINKLKSKFYFFSVWSVMHMFNPYMHIQTSFSESDPVPINSLWKQRESNKILPNILNFHYEIVTTLIFRNSIQICLDVLQIFEKIWNTITIFNFYVNLIASHYSMYINATWNIKHKS